MFKWLACRVEGITRFDVPNAKPSCIRTLDRLRTLFSVSPRLLTAFRFPTSHFRSFDSFSFMFRMSPSRKPMPSFTLVLTSGLHSLPPTAIQFDSHASPKTLPTAPDYLMKTIDLRGNSKDALGDICDDVNTDPIFEAERPETFDHGAEQTSNNSIKEKLLFLVHKFVFCKRTYFISHGPHVALKN